MKAFPIPWARLSAFGTSAGSAAISFAVLLAASCDSDAGKPSLGTGGHAGSSTVEPSDAATPASGGAPDSGDPGAGGRSPASGGAIVSASGGRGPTGTCGDGRATGLEPCDGTDVRGATCAALGFESGELKCDGFCRYDVSGCGTGTEPQKACGDGVVGPGEACDGTNFGGLSCEDAGLVSGKLGCSTTCAVDLTGCERAVCGDGIANGGEGCDGADLRGMSCQKLGYASGPLTCMKDACVFDDSKCEHCGDGLIEQSEECDGSKVGRHTCRSLGFSGGHLACGEGCQLDTQACAKCGNGTIEGGETCDGQELGGATCTSLGLADGTLACSSACLFDVRGCGGATPRCGNGVAEPGEECDGKDLAGLDCNDMSKSGGSLACAATCRFDMTGCIEPPKPDPCRDCRAERCALPIDACKSIPACVAALECIKRCENSNDDFCWFLCGGESNAVRGLSAALGAFACTTTVCTKECGGAL